MKHRYGMTSEEYLDVNLEKVFSPKELKQNRKKLLDDLKALYFNMKEELAAEEDRVLAYLILRSIPVYREIKKLNPEIKDDHRNDYLKVYITSRYYAEKHAHELWNNPEEVVKKCRQIYSCFDSVAINKSACKNLMLLGFYDFKIDEAGIEDKKWKRLNPDQQSIVRERNKVKALIY